jgi:threonine/homoserine/homoserine lactone efflux protein
MNFQFEFELLLKGIIIGFAVAAPVGPIGILTIKRTLNEGRLSGFITGMGAAFADTLYGMIAGFSLTAVSAFLLTEQFWLKLIGGIFLLVLGLVTYFSKPKIKKTEIDHKGLVNNFISTFFLTLTNPATIFSFIAIFAGIGLGSANVTHPSSLIIIPGVFVGSSLWWLTLSYFVSIFKSKITYDRLFWINRISGVFIFLFGLLALYLCITFVKQSTLY